jgi:DNA topoisomerase-1
LSLKISGKNGAFIGCGNYPDCRYTRQLAQTGEAAEVAALDGKVLGTDPDTGLEVTLKNGRFGPYLQLGEPLDKGDRPKRASIPKGWDAATIELARALMLLNLPRKVGEHPETKTDIVANFGRFGPYILHDGTYANLASADDVFEIGLNRAVTLLAEKRAGGGKRFGRGAAQRTVLKDLGEHPDEGGKIEVLDGRYGPYITWNKVNANIPKGREPASITVTEAVALLAERAAKGPPKKGGRFAKKAKPAAEAAAAKPASKPAAKKAAPKKPANSNRAKPKTDAAE